jgi:cellulose synthase/poly-beta-1,6-N-acetylglucosamine synthase-like glycosyltransferase
MTIGSAGVYICLFLALYFEVFLMISFFEKIPQKKTMRKPNYYPSVSMVVPCFNEGKTLAETVESLLSLEYPKDKLEVLVIDDGSTDDTREIGEYYAARFPAQVKYFYKKNGGKYTALNLAIAQSNSELVGCLDADSFAERDALVEVVKRFEDDPEIAAVVPLMSVHKPKNLLEVMQMAEYTFGIFVKKMFDNLGAISVLPGPFSIYRRNVFSVIGQFHHAHNTEDMEIAFRMQKHGLKIANAHTAIVYTTVPSNVWSLVKQRTRWTQGFLQNSRDYWFMFGNAKFGNFGLFALPMNIVMFFTSLFMSFYVLYTLLHSIASSLVSMLATGIGPRFSMPTLDWFYFNTNTASFVVIITLVMSFVLLMLGRKLSNATFGLASIIPYFVLYGFIAPLWLVRALWGAALAREARWR